ncbi:zinc finger protein, partial [Oryctes borbonicus]
SFAKPFQGFLLGKSLVEKICHLSRFSSSFVVLCSSVFYFHILPSFEMVKLQHFNIFLTIFSIKRILQMLTIKSCCRIQGMVFESITTKPTSNSDELQCIICTELFIKATTLNCSHSFCKYCIEEWRKKNKNCPICRAKIITANPTIVLDNFIAKVLESAPDDTKQHRDEVIKTRDVLPTRPATRSTTKRRTGTRNTPPIEISSEEGDDDSDEENEYIDFDDDLDYYDNSRHNRRSTPYYGGYGHCFNCGDTGHWSNGCPFR